jgi:uncharacterized delta-60 repeat protein
MRANFRTSKDKFIFVKNSEMRNFYLVCLSFFIAFLSQAQAPGSLDLSFSTTGYASYGPVASNYMDNAQDIVTLPNGKMVYCGTSGLTSSLGMVVVRLNCDGSIDNTFGTNGYYLYNTSGGSSFAYDMELLPNGQLLVAGATSITAANPQFTMFRLNSNGTLDQTFGVNGFFHNDIDANEDYARKILIQNNKIILVGSSKVPGYTTDRLALTRCDINGQLDVTFGTGGKTIFSNASGNSCAAQSAVIGSGQNIFICGDAYINNVYYPVLAKVDVNGQPVTTFGSNGVLIPMNFNARLFDIEYDGSKLIMAGQNGVGPWDFLLQARNETTGALVTTFGTAGSTIVDVVQADTYYELLLHPDGSILACGTTGTAGIGAARDFILSHYSGNGVLDNTWGTNGHTITSIASAWDDAYGMALYPGNCVVLAGFSAQTNTQHAIARYHYGASTPVYGCMDPLSCNYNCLATVNDGSCMYINAACNDNNPLTINDVVNSNCQCVGQAVTVIPGCTNPLACNYNPLANQDDGSCIMPGTACNDNNPNTINDSIGPNCNCVGELIVPGCTDPASCNYNPLANQDNGTCLYPGVLCDDNNPNTINDSINPDCICIGNVIVYGCTDPLSCNYNPLANVNDNSCLYPDTPCNDNNPDTFNDILDSNCNCVGTLYIYGCMDPGACNYDASANDPGTVLCLFPGSPCDDGNNLTINDTLNANCQCVGISTIGLPEYSYDFSIEPNPAADFVTIHFENLEVNQLKLIDAQGAVLLMIQNPTQQQVIVIHQIAPGTYFLQLETARGKLVKKLIHF